jgi:hypothetical protein
MLSDRFVEAVHAGDRQALGAAMAPGVEFRSPVVFKPYVSREVVELILVEGAMKVFEDFRYVERLERDRVATLIFKATVEGRELDGLDLLRFDEKGLVKELMVMVRPMSALHAVAEAMGRRFAALGLTPPE